MLVFIIVAATFCFVRADPPSSTQDLTFDCREANDETDQILANSNFEIKKQGEDNMLVDLQGFDSEVNLYAFGWKLPMSVSLSVSRGNLTGVNTLKRSTDATDCSSPIIRTLEGTFEYGPELSFKYDVGKAKFLYWEVEGKFVFKPKPRVHLVFLNSTLYCRFESISKENPGQNEYIFESENTWKGWLISKLLVRGLQQNDTTEINTQMDLWTQGEIATYFTNAWCSPNPVSRGHA